MRALSSAGDAMIGGGGGFAGAPAGAAWTARAARQVSAKNGCRFTMDTSDMFNILPPKGMGLFRAVDNGDDCEAVRRQFREKPVKIGARNIAPDDEWVIA